MLSAMAQLEDQDYESSARVMALAAMTGAEPLPRHENYEIQTLSCELLS